MKQGGGEENQNKSNPRLKCSCLFTFFHSKTGGIIPETAAREQIKYIIPVIEQALSESKSSQKKIVNRKSSIINLAGIDAIAVTVGPRTYRLPFSWS